MSPQTQTMRNALLWVAATGSMVMGLAACAPDQDVKNLFDYLNLRNSLLDPSQVGRFDKENPWGMSRPVQWPILEQLDVVDEPGRHWTTATDPLPSDLVVEQKEYIVGEGDILNIAVFELVTPGVQFADQKQVNELGNITLQNVGQVHVAGLTPTEIETKIGQLAVEKGFILPKSQGSPGPQVSVQLYQSRARVFSILGQVQASGTYNIIGTDFRLLDALALAHDVSGGNQPGMDYLYVIRAQKGAGVIPPTDTGATTQPTSAPATNPLDTLDKLNKPSGAGPTIPAPAAEAKNDSPKPNSDGIAFVRPLRKEIVQSDNPVLLLQADLDAAIGGATAPGTQPATAPAAQAPAAPAAAAPATSVPTATAAAATQSGEALMNQASGGKPGMIFVDGKWVEVSATQAGPTTMSQSESIAAATGLNAPRVLRIPIDKLKEGDPRYNIVIRSGDIINVPNIEPGEFYLLGHVSRPGVYSLTGRRVTMKQAIAAAGGLDAVAIPRRCDLIRRIGGIEVTVQVDLQRIFDGEQPDMFLKADDLVNVGTDAIAPFLAVTRNAYRASYGWGFVYDRNLYNQPVITQSQK